MTRLLAVEFGLRLLAIRWSSTSKETGTFADTGACPRLSDTMRPDFNAHYSGPLAQSS
jgi:hypothetical protein